MIIENGNFDIQSTDASESEADYYALHFTDGVQFPTGASVVAATEPNGTFKAYDETKNATYDHVKIGAATETINVTYDYESKEDVVKQFDKGVSLYDAAVESAPPADTKPGYGISQVESFCRHTA